MLFRNVGGKYAVAFNAWIHPVRMAAGRAGIAAMLTDSARPVSYTHLTLPTILEV